VEQSVSESEKNSPKKKEKKMKKKSPKRKVKKLKEVPTLKNYTINQESTRSRVKISPIK